jgi:hypothetical protein
MEISKEEDMALHMVDLERYDSQGEEKEPEFLSQESKFSRFKRFMDRTLNKGAERRLTRVGQHLMSDENV